MCHQHAHVRDIALQLGSDLHRVAHVLLLLCLDGFPISRRSRRW
jgi:hypothetical protein